MNYNYLPVRAKVTEEMVLDGQEYRPGEKIVANWITIKRLERQGKVERDVEDGVVGGTPIRNVMIFTPAYRLEPETIKALMELEWEGGLTFMVQRDNPTQDKKMNVLYQYQRGRDQFLLLGYDAMLVVESDIIPPKDALKRLAALDVDCAYGVYNFRGTKIVNVFERYPDFNGERARNVGESLSFKPWLVQRALKIGRFPCSGGGLGIILIRRRVLEAISFRREHSQGPDCDTYFTQDVYERGFSQMADFGVLCGHKDTDGKISWPEAVACPA